MAARFGMCEFSKESRVRTMRVPAVRVYTGIILRNAHIYVARADILKPNWIAVSHIHVTTLLPHRHIVVANTQNPLKKTVQSSKESLR